MSHGALLSLAILAIVTTMNLPSVLAADYNEKWGDNSGEKGLDDRFIVGNWKQRNEERKHLNDPPGNIEKVVDVLETGGRRGRSMERENYPKQQKWGNLVGDGVDSHFSHPMTYCDDILPLGNSPEGCALTLKYSQLMKNPFGNLSCPCNVTTNHTASNEVCCKWACCREIVVMAEKCNNCSYADHTICEAFKVLMK